MMKMITTTTITITVEMILVMVLVIIMAEMVSIMRNMMVIILGMDKGETEEI